jgi:hypothetical protein
MNVRPKVDAGDRAAVAWSRVSRSPVVRLNRRRAGGGMGGKPISISRLRASRRPSNGHCMAWRTRVRCRLSLAGRIGNDRRADCGHADDEERARARNHPGRRRQLAHGTRVGRAVCQRGRLQRRRLRHWRPRVAAAVSHGEFTAAAGSEHAFGIERGACLALSPVTWPLASSRCLMI